LFQQQLRSRYCQRVYFAQESDSIRSNTAITDEEWELTSQLEAVVRGAVDLNFNCQIDSRPTISSTWLYVVRARASISTNTSYDVVDLNEQVLDEENARGWGAGTPFKCLPKRRLTTEELLPDAKLLRQRLELEFARYLKDPEDSHLVRGMILDPVMLTAGHMFLQRFGDTHRFHWHRGRALLLADIEEDIVLHQHLGHLSTSRHTHEEDPVVLIGEDSEEVLGTGDEQDFFSTVMGGSSLQLDVEQYHINLQQTPKELAKAELHCWEKLTIDWAAFLREHQPDVKFDAGDVRRKSPYTLVESVDILKWWKVNERLYPWIARAAVLNHRTVVSVQCVASKILV
jgi:hypothetical protein